MQALNGISFMGLITSTALVVSNDAPTAVKVAARLAKVVFGDRIQICDGDNDQVQINAALNALPATGGKVVLLDGTYTIADPITFPKSKVTLEGQGRSTFIDGDGLATNEHGIVISGRTDCVVRNLAIQTEDGGGKTCHCIFIEDGSDNFLIEGVTVVNSDSDGIRIEGTNINDGLIQGLHIEDTDNSGIKVTMDGGNYMNRLRVESSYLLSDIGFGIDLEDVENAIISNNIIKDWEDGGIFLSLCNYALIEGNQVIGSLAGPGIYAVNCEELLIVNNEVTGNATGIQVGVSDYAITEDNFVQGNLEHGIYYQTSHHGVIQGNEVLENSQEFDDSYDGIFLYSADYNFITGNIIRRGALANKHQYGINISNPGCEYNRIIDNDLYDSGSTGKVNDAGTGTISPSVVVPFSDGTDPQDSGYLIDADTELARAFLFLPDEVQQVRFLRIYARAVGASATTMALEINVNGGADNEAYTTHATAAPNTPSTSSNFAANDIIYWTLTSADILALSAGDSVEVKVLHEAANAGGVATNAYIRTVEIGYF